MHVIVMFTIQVYHYIALVTQLVHIDGYTHMCTHACVYTHTHVHIYIYAHMHTLMHTQMLYMSV